ncbi:hypothetical protein D1970_19315 [Mesobacillus zeae]|uniref:DUF4871 domain-containing protein n=2 Tax=Mesobacillus zeae TaxID=1917180 RepID=A0A398AXH4_9BACI|nr:hypothetical protein D1970_19315 [Mesobacillus zeae]
MLFGMAACTSSKAAKEKLILPDNVPTFVQEKEFEKVNWERKAVEFGERGIVGNKNKSGVIAPEEMKSERTEKWMWHFWGVEKPEDTSLTVVGYHKETETVHQIVTEGWTRGIGGGSVNGADSHAVSHVVIPKPGEWAILLYTNEKLFDTLVFDIKK